MFNYMSGVKPTGEFHLGNYVSTIKPIVDDKLQDQTLFLIADGHSLTSDTKDVDTKRMEIAKILCAFGISNIVFQSWFPEVFELMWILSNYTSKGLMNRAHAYRSIKDNNIEQDEDPDKGINMGLYNYPVLMTADLVLFECNKVFIGDDQLQHIEMANDIVNRFNYYNHDLLSVPTPSMKCEKTIPGFDGRKMSKSYNNTIPLISSKKKLKKHIFSIKTNSKNEGEPKYWVESPITRLYEVFTYDEKCEILKEDMMNGMGWGEVKQIVFNDINSQIEQGRETYNQLNIDDIMEVLLSTYNKIKDQVHFKMNEQIKGIVYET